MMARSTNRSNQRPDTLMQDRKPRDRRNLLRRTAGPYIGSKTAMAAVRLARPQYLRKLTTLVHRASRQMWATSRLFRDKVAAADHIIRKRLLSDKVRWPCRPRYRASAALPDHTAEFESSAPSSFISLFGCGTGAKTSKLVEAEDRCGDDCGGYAHSTEHP